jgi:protocatechuate 3,4-dioxygenase beta subunit
MTNRITRRTLVRHLGSLGSGTALLGPGIARALVATPSQTEGPFYPPQPHAETDVDLTMLEGHDRPASGDVILVRGRVTDLEGSPLADIRVDIWQANHWGRYAHPRDPNSAPLDPHFQGIGIAYTDTGGLYGFRTIKPAAYPLGPLGGSGWRARHIHFKLTDGAGRELTTQMYFEGDPLLADDGPYNSVPESQRHLLLTSPVTDEATDIPVHRFDIALPGAV